MKGGAGLALGVAFDRVAFDSSSGSSSISHPGY